VSSPTLVTTGQTTFAGGATSRTTGSIAVLGGDLIVVKSMDAGYGAGQSYSISGSGAGIAPGSWIQQLSAGAQSNYSQVIVWSGVASGSGNMTVTVTHTSSTTYGLAYEVWRNAKVGNTGSKLTNSGAQVMELSFTTTYANSGISWCGDDFDASSPGTRTYVPGSMVEDFWDHDSTDGYSVGSSHSPNIGSAGTYTIGASNWSTNNGTICCLEIAYQLSVVPCGYMQTYTHR
jgi:hypothetical protein